MYVRNYIKYSCPEKHAFLSFTCPITLCRLAQHYPIQRPCNRRVDDIQPSDEWCIDCRMREQQSKRKEGVKGKKTWHDALPGGAKWSGYAGENGKDTGRDEIPQ
jgi:hypothetical protein